MTAGKEAPWGSPTLLGRMGSEMVNGALATS